MSGSGFMRNVVDGRTVISLKTSLAQCVISVPPLEDRLIVESVAVGEIGTSGAGGAMSS
jgi:hypothetical protein